MASQTRSAFTASDDTAVGSVAWSSPASVSADEGIEASASLLSSQSSYYLKTSSHGFTIPTGSTITGVKATIHRRSPDPGATLAAITDGFVYLAKAGAVQAVTSKAYIPTWPITETAFEGGGEADLWDIALTYADVNDTGFGVAISVIGTGGAFANVGYIDHISLTVYYEAADASEIETIPAYPYSEWADLLAVAGDAFFDGPTSDGATIGDTGEIPQPSAGGDPCYVFEHEAGDWFGSHPLDAATAAIETAWDVYAMDTAEPAYDYYATGDYFTFQIHIDAASDAHACGCAGTVLLVAQGSGTVAIVVSASDPEMATSYGTSAFVSQGSGTIQRTLDCTC